MTSPYDASKSSRTQRIKSRNSETQIGGDDEAEVEDEDEVEDGFSGRRMYEGMRGEEDKRYDRDPEFAEILGSCLDDPQKARSKVDDWFRVFSPIQLLEFIDFLVRVLFNLVSIP